MLAAPMYDVTSFFEMAPRGQGLKTSRARKGTHRRRRRKALSTIRDLSRVIWPDLTYFLAR